jgi:DNA-binding beta-propeller fold protein YncE
VFQTTSNFGIVVEQHLRRISFFSTDTLEILNQITLGYDFVDTAITSDCSNVVVTSDFCQTLVQIETQLEPPKVVAIQEGQSSMADVDITPDDQFAVTVTGLNHPFNMQSYSFLKNKFISTIPIPYDAVGIAISPNGNGLILIDRSSANTVRRFKIDADGVLFDTGQEFISGGTRPFNITFTPDGNFAFVANLISNSIGILETQNPENITLLNAVGTNNLPGTIVVSRDGSTVYVLTESTVDIFNFNQLSGTLSFVKSFGHGLLIDPRPLFGANQMALNKTETKLFISANISRELKVFTISGKVVGYVAGIEANGGIAICHPDKHNRLK